MSDISVTTGRATWQGRAGIPGIEAQADRRQDARRMLQLALAASWLLDAVLHAARATLVLSVVVAAVIWVFGEAFGTIFTGGGTDPNSGSLLVLQG